MEIWHMVLLGGGFIATGFLCALLLVRQLGAHTRRLQREISGLRSIAIRDAVDGRPARITGTVRPLGDLLSAPLTGRRCVAFDVTIDSEPRGVEGPEPRVPEVDNVRRMSAFAIEDPTGVAIVEQGELLLAADVARDRQQLPPRVRTFLASENKDTGERLIDVGEAVLLPGATVTACGVARWEVAPDAKAERGYRDAPMRLRLQSTPEFRLIIATDAEVLTRR